MDTIGDMIIRIKNANHSHGSSVLIPYSRLCLVILEKLVSEGFITSVIKRNRKGKRFIEVFLTYIDKKPRVSDVKRISKLSRRVYMKAQDLRPVRHGFGRLIVSTPKGIFTGKEAREKNLGGEALFSIW
jgi:small subunit ribosomal protein S8